MKVDVKGLFLKGLYGGGWRRPCPFEEGYTVILPSPMDMPFLLRFALEGLVRIDTTHCRQILVVPDGRGEDGGRALAAVAEEFTDPRIAMAPMREIDRKVLMRIFSGASAHWMMSVTGTTAARCAHAFLHDSDAFFVEEGGLERQYRECRDRNMDVLGVTARVDPAFVALGYQIPGTWELMFSTRWARSWSPYDLKGRIRSTPHGEVEFDSMLYPMFMDYPKGAVGVMERPPGVVHFNGTIVTYRVYESRGRRGVVDELFRLLLLALLEDLVPPPDGRRAVPSVDELARGLDDPSAPVTYGTDMAAFEYPEFRRMIDQLCDSPVIRGERAGRLRSLIRPFDEHFASRAAPSGLERPASRPAGLA